MEAQYSYHIPWISFSLRKNIRESYIDRHSIIISGTTISKMTQHEIVLMHLFELALYLRVMKQCEDGLVAKFPNYVYVCIMWRVMPLKTPFWLVIRFITILQVVLQLIFTLLLIYTAYTPISSVYPQ
jgi:hypothetical protein